MGSSFLNALATFSDGTTRDLTSQVTWSSDNADVTLANDNLGPNSIGQASMGLGAPNTGNGTPVTVTATLGSTMATFNSDNVSVYTIEPSTGALSAGTAVPAGIEPMSVITTP